MKVLVSCYHGQHLWLKEKRRTLQEQARLDREAAIVGILALGASRILLGLFTSASYSGPVILHLERLSENCLALCRPSSRRIRGAVLRRPREAAGTETFADLGQIQASKLRTSLRLRWLQSSPRSSFSLQNGAWNMARPFKAGEGWNPRSALSLESSC